MKEINKFTTFVINGFTTFIVKGIAVNMISSETHFGLNTVAEIDNKYYYLGNIKMDIASAILVWQYMSGVHLSAKEFNEIIKENIDVDKQ